MRVLLLLSLSSACVALDPAALTEATVRGTRRRGCVCLMILTSCATSVCFPLSGLSEAIRLFIFIIQRRSSGASDRANEQGSSVPHTQTKTFTHWGKLCHFYLRYPPGKKKCDEVKPKPSGHPTLLLQPVVLHS